MTYDFLAYEIQTTLGEARAATRHGLAHFFVSVMFLVATGWTIAAQNPVAGLAAVGALMFATFAAGEWRAAADDRRIAAWLGGAEGCQQ